MKLTVLTGGILALAAAQAADTVREFGQAPLAFEPNRGQWAEGASFGTHGQGFSAMFHGADVTYSLHAGDKRAQVKTRWVGAAATKTVSSAGQLPGTANYYLGNDESRWISGLATYKKLRVPNVYPGIDVVYYGNRQQLEYDLIVAPGANVGRIGIAFDGGQPHVDADGNLVLATGAGTFVQHRPVAFQEAAGKRTAVDARYVIDRGGVVKLALGTYDRRRELVIDPTIAWAATMGSGTNGSGNATGVAVDSTGNVYVAGTTSAADFPVVNAYKSSLGTTNCCSNSDAFVTKFSPDGVTILFSTYFGGTGDDFGTGLALDSAGNVYLTGFTRSTDMGTKNAYQSALRGTQDAFAAKFSSTGSFLYGTYLGGSSTDLANGIAVDSSGNMYLTGSTYSSDFPKAGAYQSALKGGSNGFVTKLTADGSSLVFSTYLGGSSYDIPAAIALGPSNSVYVAGYTTSSDFPTLSAFQPSVASANNGVGFVTRLAASGASLLYSTYLGSPTATSTTIAITAIDVDSTGAAYVTGYTSGSFPLKNPIQATIRGGRDAFLTKLSADGSSLVYSTYYGGSQTDQPSGVRVDAAGNATIVGLTSSNDYPTVAAFRPQVFNQDAFITTFNAAGDTVLFSTFLGGQSNDQASAIALDSSGNIYVAGSTSSSDFPSNGSRYYGTPFVAKLSGPVTSVPVTLNTVPAGLQVTVDGLTVTTPKIFLWAAGVTHQLDVPVPQASTGPNVSNFLSWSNGGSKSQSLTTPAATTLTATLDNQACLYSFATPTSAAFGQAGGYSYITLTTQAGCPWTPVSSASWLTTNSYQTSGSTQFSFSAAANTNGGSRSATITVSGAVFTVTQGFTTPTVSYQNSCCGANSGLSQTFTYIVNDNDGTSDLTISNMLINNVLDGRNACYLAYDHANQILYLVNDGGTIVAPMPFDSSGHGSGVLSNSQCSIDGTKTYVSQYNGSTQSQVTIGLTFTGAFGGNKVVYLAARDKEGMNSGWYTGGVWNVPMTATYPKVVSSGYNSGYNNGSSTISVTYQDVSNNTNLSPSQILINSAIDGRNACYMGYDHKNNSLFLVADNGTTLLPSIAPGSGTATQQNSQCIIYAQGSTVQSNGKNYTLSVQVFFMPAFRGQQVVYGASQTIGGGNTGWQAVNAFTVR